MNVLDPIRECLAELESLAPKAEDAPHPDPVIAAFVLGGETARSHDIERLRWAIERAEAPGADASDYAACHEHETAYLIGEECPECSPAQRPSPEDTEKAHALSSARHAALAETIAQAERDGLGRVRFRHVTYAVSSLPPMGSHRATGHETRVELVEEFDLVQHESGQWFRVETGGES